MNVTKNMIQPEEMASLLKQKLLLGGNAIFCGAGISFNSGLPLVNELINYTLSLLNVDDVNAQRILNSNLPFESFIQTLADEVGIDDILDIFSKGDPNKNHELIALLAKEGAIKTILTTNFDTLIEKALVKIGLKDGDDYQVLSNDRDFGNINWKDGTIKVIKIHGCVSDRDEMAITLKLVAKKTMNQNKSKLLSSFFSSDIHQHVFILGYSCSDLFDITPIIESTEGAKSRILFFEHIAKDSKIEVEDISIKEFKNPFKNYLGQRYFFNTDAFTELLWKEISALDYGYKKSEISWRENIDQWHKAASSYSSAIKNHITARIFYDIGEYDLSINLWEQGIYLAQMENNQVFFYAQLGSIGMALNAIGKFQEAKRCLEESVKACGEINNVQGQIAQLQVLGNVYRNLRDFENAVIVFEKAIALASIHETESLCPCYGNLCNVYVQVHDHDNVIKVLEKGLPIAIATGNKQSEGSMLSSLGVAFFLKGNIDRAVDLLLESIKVTRHIGDKQGESMALHNLSNFFLQLDDYDKCLTYSRLGLEIATQIGSRQTEAGAQYNIGTVYFFKGEQDLAIFHLKIAYGIYSELFDQDHSYTISAKIALHRAEKHPDHNKTTKKRMR